MELDKKVERDNAIDRGGGRPILQVKFYFKPVTILHVTIFAQAHSMDVYPGLVTLHVIAFVIQVDIKLFKLYKNNIDQCAANPPSSTECIEFCTAGI